LTYVNKIEHFYYSIESLACAENYVSFCRLSNAFVYVLERKSGGRYGAALVMSAGALGLIGTGADCALK
jgi:hypothetical protein